MCEVCKDSGETKSECIGESTKNVGGRNKRGCQITGNGSGAMLSNG